MKLALISAIRLLIESCLMYGTFFHMLTPKFSLWKTIGIGFTGYAAALVCYLLVFPINFQLPFFVAETLLLVHLLFTDRLLRKIYSVLFIYLGFIGVEFCFSTAYVFTTGKSMEELVQFFQSPSLGLLLTFYVAFAVYLKCLTRLFSQKAGMLSWKGQKNFLLVPVCQLLMLYGLICCANQIESTWVNIVLIAADCVTLFTVFFLFRSMDVAFHGVRAEERLHYMEVQQKMQAEYYQELAAHTAVIRRLRHDIANHVQTMRVLLQNREYHQAEQYFSAIEEAYQKTELPVYCDNAMVNAVLYHKVSQAKAQGISLKTQLTLSADPPFDAMDLTILFLNIMDNALEAASAATGDKRISVFDHWSGRLYSIKVINSKAPEPVRMKAGHLVTTKSDHLLHGQGSAMIEELAEKYNGSAFFQDEGNLFSTVVLLQAPQETGTDGMEKL